MAHTIEAVFASASQQALAVYHQGNYMAAREQYTLLISDLSARYSPRYAPLSTL